MAARLVCHVWGCCVVIFAGLALAEHRPCQLILFAVSGIQCCEHCLIRLRSAWSRLLVLKKAIQSCSCLLPVLFLHSCQLRVSAGMSICSR